MWMLAVYILEHIRMGFISSITTGITLVRLHLRVQPLEHLWLMIKKEVYGLPVLIVVLYIRLATPIVMAI